MALKSNFRTLITAACFIILQVSITCASGVPVRIGVTVSLEGKYLEPSLMVQSGYRLWEKQINERGGLLGRPVKVLFFNDKSNPDLVGPLYEKLINQENVDMVLSPYGTPLTLKASEVTERHGYTMLACAAAGDMIWSRGYEYIFGVYALAERYYIGFQDLMARNGFYNLGLVYESSDFHRAVAKGVKKWAKRFHLNLAYENGYPVSENDFESILEQAAQKDLDGLIFSAYPPDCYAFIDIMKQKEYRPGALAFSIVPIHPEFNTRVGPFGDNIFAPSQWEPDERIPFPGTQQFIKDFKAFSGTMPTYHAASAYSACQILEKAVSHTGVIDHKKIRKYISSFDTVTIMGRFKVDHTGRQVGHNPILIQWQDNKKQIVYPINMRTAAPRFHN